MYSLLTVDAAIRKAAATGTKRPAILSSSTGEWNLLSNIAEQTCRYRGCHNLLKRVHCVTTEFYDTKAHITESQLDDSERRHRFPRNAFRISLSFTLSSFSTIYEIRVQTQLLLEEEILLYKIESHRCDQAPRTFRLAKYVFYEVRRGCRVEEYSNTYSGVLIHSLPYAWCCSSMVT